MKFTQVNLYRNLSYVIISYLFFVLLNTIILTVFASMPLLSAFLSSVYIYLITVIAIFSSWVIALFITFVFGKAAELLSLEQEYFGKSQIDIPSKIFNLVGSIFLFYTAFASFNLDITLFNVPLSFNTFLLIIVTWIVLLVSGLVYILSKIRSSALEKLKASFLLFASISLTIFLLPLIPSFNLLETFTVWNTFRIFLVFALLLLVMCYTVNQKSKVADKIDALREKRGYRSDLIFGASESKSSNKKEIKISIVLDRRILSKLLPNQESYNLLHFAVSFSAISFLIGMFMPTIINLSSPVPLQLADILIFGLFLISGAFTWIMAIDLGSTMQPSEEKILEEVSIDDNGKLIKMEKPVYINTTSVISSAFFDALLSPKGYLMFGMLGVFIFITLPKNLAPLWSSIVGSFIFPVNYVTGFAAIVAAFIVGFGISSLTKKIHVILMTIGTLVVLVVPLYFLLFIFFPINNSFLSNLLYLSVVTALVFIAYTYGLKEEPLPISRPPKPRKSTLSILLPSSIESLPVLLTIFTFSDQFSGARVRTFATSKQIFDFLDSSMSSKIERPGESYDVIVLDALSYFVLKGKYNEKFDYTAVRTIGTSGNHLLVPNALFIDIIRRDEELKHLTRDEVLLLHQKWIDFLRTGYFENEEERSLFLKLNSELIKYLKYNDLFVAVVGVNPPVKNEAYYIREYLVKKIIGERFKRKNLNNVILIDVLPSQLFSVAYFFDLIFVPEPYSTLLTNSRDDSIRSLEHLSGLFCASSSSHLDCKGAVDYYIFKALFKRDPSTEEVLNLGFFGGNSTYLLLIKNKLYEKYSLMDATRMDYIIKWFLEHPNNPAFNYTELKLTSVDKDTEISLALNIKLILLKLLLLSIDIWLNSFKSKLFEYDSIKDLVEKVGVALPLTSEKESYIKYLLSFAFFREFFQRFVTTFSRETMFSPMNLSEFEKPKTILSNMESFIDFINTKFLLKGLHMEYQLTPFDLFESISTQTLWAPASISLVNLIHPGVRIIGDLAHEPRGGLIFSFRELLARMVENGKEILDSEFDRIVSSLASIAFSFKFIDDCLSQEELYERLTSQGIFT